MTLRSNKQKKSNKKQWAFLPWTKDTKFWTEPKLHMEKVIIIIVCSLLPQHCSYKAVASARKTQCNNAAFCAKGNRGRWGMPHMCLLLTHSLGTFYTIVELCGFPLVAMASKKHMPCFHFFKLNSLKNKIVSIWGYSCLQPS